MKIICTKLGYEGRLATADRELADRFEKDISVYGEPGLAVYPKTDWKLKDDPRRDDP